MRYWTLDAISAEYKRPVHEIIFFQVAPFSDIVGVC